MKTLFITTYLFGSMIYLTSCQDESKIKEMENRLSELETIANKFELIVQEQDSIKKEKQAKLKQFEDIIVDDLNDENENEDKIKSDLIGTKIGTWNFDSPSEYVDIRINDKKKTGDLLELDTEFILQGYSSKRIYYLHALLIYKKNKGKWKYVNGIKLDYIWDYHSMQLE
tara:strand:- start:1575 stop:2084 length:510 start_codon:yes stop_codon:yes gene_type:complete